MVVVGHGEGQSVFRHTPEISTSRQIPTLTLQNPIIASTLNRLCPDQPFVVKGHSPDCRSKTLLFARDPGSSSRDPFLLDSMRLLPRVMLCAQEKSRCSKMRNAVGRRNVKDVCTSTPWAGT